MKPADLKKDVDIIFAHWQKVMDHPAAKLLPVREKLIKARLREGYTVDQVKQAIDGCRSSKFHMGENDQGAIFDDLTLICRNGAKLEWFINLLAKRSAAANCSNCDGNRRVQVNDWNAPCPECRPSEARAFWKARGK